MKVVINTDYGGFGLSEAAKKRYVELSGTYPDDFYALARNDKCLVQVVEELGAAANGLFANLAVVEVENGRWFKIREHDGFEFIRYKDLESGWQLAKED